MKLTPRQSQVLERLDLAERLRADAKEWNIGYFPGIDLCKAADLIESQHAEIERLREMHDIDSKTIEILMARCSDDDREIARLRAVEKAADRLNDEAVRAVFEDGHTERLLIEDWPLMDAIAQYREARASGG